MRPAHFDRFDGRRWFDTPLTASLSLIQPPDGAYIPAVAFLTTSGVRLPRIATNPAESKFDSSGMENFPPVLEYTVIGAAVLLLLYTLTNVVDYIRALSKEWQTGLITCYVAQNRKHKRIRRPIEMDAESSSAVYYQTLVFLNGIEYTVGPWTALPKPLGGEIQLKFLNEKKAIIPSTLFTLILIRVTVALVAISVARFLI